MNIKYPHKAICPETHLKQSMIGLKNHSGKFKPSKNLYHPDKIIPGSVRITEYT